MSTHSGRQRRDRPPRLSLETALEHPVLAAFVVLALIRLPYLLLRAFLGRRKAASFRRRLTLLASDDGARRQHARVVGLFHPFCNAGGGGERVLWTAVSAMQGSSPDLSFVVYTGDYPAASKDDIIERASRHFNILLEPTSIHLVPLTSRRLISDSYWRRLTLLGQAFGAVVCAWEALAGPKGVVPDVFIDTMGYAWAYPFIRFFAGADLPIGAYVHYPTISPDMVARVRLRQHTHTNVAAARSPLRSALKLIYYALLIRAYAWCLGFGQEIMANSSWTKAHLDTLLGSGGSGGTDATTELSLTPAERVSKVFPPCETGDLGKLPIVETGRERVILSLAQFRPEKDHPAQLRALKELFDLQPSWKAPGPEQVRLVMIGSVRDDADGRRVKALRSLADELGLTDNIEIVVNADYPTLLAWLGRSSVGLSTMVDEHFGINVVEFMAAGLIPLAHASAGPWLDIIAPYPLPHAYQPAALDAPPSLVTRTGWHAKTPREFAAALVEILDLSPAEREAIRHRAKASVEERFGREAFVAGWEQSLTRLLSRLKVE